MFDNLSFRSALLPTSLFWNQSTSVLENPKLVLIAEEIFTNMSQTTYQFTKHIPEDLLSAPLAKLFTASKISVC